MTFHYFVTPAPQNSETVGKGFLMRRKIIDVAARVAAAACCVVLLAGAVSCAYKDSDEIVSSFKEKYPRARELAEIVYGDSLAYIGESDDEGYFEVSPDAEIQSIDALKAELKKVYTNGYVNIIENTALNGASFDGVIIYAKFAEKDGKLYVCPESTEHFGKPRELQTDTARVTKRSRIKAELTVECGGESFVVTMEKQNGEWLIDSSVY